MFAESARRFLAWWLGRLEVTSGEIDHHWYTDLKQQVLEKKGIYFLWCKENGNFLVPVYVGITGVTFSDRFADHKQINRILNGNCPTTMKERKVYVMIKEMQLPVAKFLESTLLYAFNFALNKHENDQRRHHLVQAIVKQNEGRQHFTAIMGNFLQRLKDLPI